MCEFRVRCIFDRPVQTSTVHTVEIGHKPTTGIDQRDIQFTIAGDHEQYIDPDMHIYIRRRLVGADSAVLDEKDYTAGVNNMLYSLFDQCNVSLNSTLITHSSDKYQYRAFLETLLSYWSDAAETHLTNAYWYKDTGNLLTCESTDTSADMTNTGWVRRWNLQKQSKEIEMEGLLHADICNAQTLIIPGVSVTVLFDKSPS
jgi:hypothetical protein